MGLKARVAFRRDASHRGVTVQCERRGCVVRRETFKDYLVRDYRGRNGRPLPDPSARSYCTYVAQAEALLGRNLDNIEPDEPGLIGVITALRSAARAKGTPAGTLNNCRSGVRAYAEFLRYSKR